MSTAMPDSTFKHVDQVDEPTFSASDLKDHLDSQAREIIAWFNATHIGTDKIHVGAIGSATGITSSITTVSTSYVDVTDMAVAITTSGGSVLVFVDTNMQNNGLGNFNYLAISVDGSAEMSENIMKQAVADYSMPISAIALVTGLSADLHTFKARWKTSAGTASQGGQRRVMVVVEVKA